MQEKIYKLIYISSAAIPLADAEIDEILRKSKENNSKVNVTGMLIYREGNFIQLLEGDELAVKNLYSVITKDSRHRGCIILDEGYVSKRCFEGWSMNYQKFDGKPIFTSAEIDSDETGVLWLLSNFVLNMR